MATPADKTFFVAVKFTGNVAEVQNAGLKIGEVVARFAFGEIPGKRRLLHGRVAVTAIDPVVRNIMLVAKRDWLLQRHITSVV